MEAARREGTVNLYDSWNPEVHIALRSKFAEKFGIELTFTSVPKGQELVPKLERERMAGLYLADVVGSASTVVLVLMKPKGMLDPIEPMLVLPEAKDASIRVGGKLFLDMEQKLYVPLSAQLDPLLSRNTGLVRDGEIKSFSDLLDPKWRGKIAMNDPTSVGSGLSFVNLIVDKWGRDKATDYFRQFVKQEPLVGRDFRILVEWLGRGKVALGVGLPVREVMAFKDMGAPVAFVKAAEGGVVGNGPGGIARPAGKLPHPNAAKLFVNWLLTKEGSSLFSKGNSQPSARLDVSTEGFEDVAARAGDVFEDEDAVNRKAQLIDFAREIFAPILQ
ncbi:MAG: extracellular solute-binding protein [Chloroflexi bacterium]|nr:extracellular solute-binding protein [Chloroflexota bacterium]